MKYEDSGVDIERGRRAKKAMAKHVSSTWGPEVLSETGAFGGLYRLGPGYEDPVLVSSVDGVGTKLIAARMAGRYDTVGQELVNHCVDDILVQGAKPLFFLDYIASGSLDPQIVASVVEGVSTACRAHCCALIRSLPLPGRLRTAGRPRDWPRRWFRTWSSWTSACPNSTV